MAVCVRVTNDGDREETRGRGRPACGLQTHKGAFPPWLPAPGLLPRLSWHGRPDPPCFTSRTLSPPLGFQLSPLRPLYGFRPTCAKVQIPARRSCSTGESKGHEGKKTQCDPAVPQHGARGLEHGSPVGGSTPVLVWSRPCRRQFL